MAEAQVTKTSPPHSLRAVLHSAFTYVRSYEANQATANITLDHLLVEHLASLKKDETRNIVDGRGTVVGQRPSRWDRIDQLEKDVLAAVEAVAAAGEDSDQLQRIGVYEL
jgi:hypothetical protein